MNKKQQEHIMSILDEFSNLAYKKYNKGTKEHSGHLWEVDGIIDMLLEELIDGVVYCITLKHQLEGLKTGKIKEKK